MKTEQLIIRCNEQLKKDVDAAALKDSISRTDFIKQAIIDKLQTDGLLESEQKFLKLFEVGFQTYYEPYFHKLVQNQRNVLINVKTIIEQNNIAFKHLDLPTELDEIKPPLYNHPITEIAIEKATKGYWGSIKKENDLDGRYSN